MHSPRLRTFVWTFVSSSGVNPADAEVVVRAGHRLLLATPRQWSECIQLAPRHHTLHPPATSCSSNLQHTCCLTTTLHPWANVQAEREDVHLNIWINYGGSIGKNRGFRSLKRTGNVIISQYSAQLTPGRLSPSRCLCADLRHTGDKWAFVKIEVSQSRRRPLLGPSRGWKRFHI